ncbi:antibiotic biosynthesis monooxygenase [Paenibacillus zeisoli]|uniref:Antibiotic biosynthesis monooxygenase n=1 Tax=Paenibacillus zeisoli TaxID=2496267 RepID=A0A433X9F0_9BACL|nr:putative quinol monooxygenase [Paenibacillus zeisoli]RUT30682.1 antibiotic biosynthesis monooxygenase [Paenibacillus zeisoli]
MSRFGLYTKFTTHDSQRNALVEILLEAACEMEAVEGCILYIINTPDNDPNSVWVTEVWNDASAHQASLALEGARELIQKAKPLIARIEQIKLNPLGGKGV